MTVGELLGGGFNVLKRRPKELIIWTIIQLALSVALVAAIMPFMASMTAAQQQAMGGGAPPAIPSGMGLFVLAYLLILVWFLMLFTAIVRGAAASGEDTFAWLRFGGDELRLIGLGLLYIIASIVVWLVLGVIFGVIVGIAAAASAVAGTAIGIVGGILLFCAIVWLSVRISLVGAVFVLERSFAIRKGWQATRGHFWTLFLAYLVMTIAYIVLELIIILIMYPGYFSSFGGATDPAQALARQQAMMASLTSPSIGMSAMWIIGTLLGTAAFAYYVGVIATAAISATGYSRQDLAELESHFE